MNFLGMGAMEIIVIMVIALIIFGPDRLPEMGAQAGKALRDLRNATREMTGEFEESITDVRSAMDEMKMTVSDVKRETRDLAVSVTEITDSAAEEIRSGAKTVNTETAQLVAAANPTVSGNGNATANGTATAKRAQPAKTSIPKTPQTEVAQPPKPVAKRAVPTKKDPLADLGGIDSD